MIKSCNNHCAKAWCCSGEFFTDLKERWNSEAIIGGKLKGFEFYEYHIGDINIPNMVIVRVNAPCKHMEWPGNCFLHNSGQLKPIPCRTFPNSQHDNIVLTISCKYFNPKKHYIFENLTKYQPK